MTIVFFLLSLLFANAKFALAVEEVCDYCCVPEEYYGGLVPCGRRYDDPTTPIDETARCTLCHLLVLIKKIIDFLTGTVAFPILVLMIIIGGIMWVTAAGSEAQIRKGKGIIKTALIAIVILLAAWVTINTVIVFMTPASAPWQKWSTIECPVATLGTYPTCCGDDEVQQPDGYGFDEQCETGESQADFLARGVDLDGDGDCDNVDYLIMQSTCLDCIFACFADPNFENIGKGCYDPGTDNVCQKGIWVCDKEAEEVVCADVYSQAVEGFESHFTGSVLYDYCCRATEDPGYTVANAQADINALVWVRQKPNASSIGTAAAEAADPGSGTFSCDEVCRKINRVCIGTAITDNLTTFCYGVRCHAGANCTLDSNMARIDCRLEYPFTRKDASSSNKCTNPETYYVGYTSCLCR